jgi:hypothetical protein
MPVESRIKRIRVKIPEDIRSKFLGYDTVGFGISYQRPIHNGDFVGDIHVYLYSKQRKHNPSMALPVVSITNLRYSDNGHFTREVKNIANRPDILSKLLSDSKS